MLDGLVESTATATVPREQKIEGIAIAQVIDNVDALNMGRVQIRLSWLPDFEPWARVATPMAGPRRGMYFMPQVGDEVLVAFNHGDVRDPFVIGSLWNGQDDPPTRAGTDAISQRIIRTPAGHEVAFDDAGQTITVTSSSKHSVTLGPDSIVLSTPQESATATLHASGTLTLAASVRIDISAPQVTIGGTIVSVTGDGTATLEGRGTCIVKGGLVAIN